MPPLPKARALKRDDNVGLDLTAAARRAGRPGGQMGRVGQPTKLANLLQVLGTVP